VYTDFAVDEHTSDDAPTFTLHPVKGVVWAAFWGSPLAAGIIMAINYHRLGKADAARNAVAIAAIATVALFAGIFAIPEEINVPSFVFIAAQLAVVQAIANALQGDLIRRHAEQGGALASPWPSVGVGLLCLPLVLGSVFGAVFLLEPSWGTVVKFGDDEIYYAGDATEEDARKLAGVLENIGIFGAGGSSVRIEYSSTQHTVSFPLVRGAWDDTEAIDVYREIGRAIVASGFPTPLTIQLCDEYYEAKRTFVIQH